MTARRIKQALISVSDKTDLVTLAEGLRSHDIAILATGGTLEALIDAGIPVRELSDYTGFPEMMDGRVKTLHPKVHGGILARRGQDDEALGRHGIDEIDLVVVNLYPFEATVGRPDCGWSETIENIDIGGPTLIRAAAKNYRYVTVLVEPSDYGALLAELDAGAGTVSEATRWRLAVGAFERVAAYDAAISNHLGRFGTPDGDRSPFARTLTMQVVKTQDLRYGENPHQRAALYADRHDPVISAVTSEQLQGKELSFNNIADADAALACVREFEGPACVIVKHANPCGAAVAASVTDAYRLAFATDRESAFGGIIAVNRELDRDTVDAILDSQFVEAIIAPAVTDGARELLGTKKNVRVLVCGESATSKAAGPDIKRVHGGLLVQDRDLHLDGVQDLEIVSHRAPTDQESSDLLFGAHVAKYVKSNAIVYAKDGRTIGVGAGQMSRVYSARIAAIKAHDQGLEVAGAVMASDAFFPFRDGIDAAAKAGITAVIQPGGSVRDREVIDAANEHDMAMVVTGFRHFRH